MNFYDQVSKNKGKTVFFIGIFIVLVILLGWAIARIYDAPYILYFAVIISLVQAVSGYWFGDKIALSMSGAKKAERKDFPELHRLVENNAITAGLPKPEIYVINDPSPNAFATGRDPKHSSLAFTTGLLEALEKKELEGVVAHELSHIGNRDTLLMVVVVILVSIVALISDLLLRIGFWGGFSSDDDNNSSGGALMLIIGIIIAILAPLVATVIQLAISRKREFMADASGSLLTRYPEGLASALRKISSNKQPVRKANSATALLYIADPTKKRSWFSKLLDTHPPVEERIKALELMAK